MSQQKNKKKPIGCIIAAIVGGIVAIISGIIIIGLLFFIAAPTLLNAADKAREGAVKANVSAAASTIATFLTVKEYPADQASAEAIKELNDSGTPDDKTDDAISPFDEDLPAYSDTPGPGVVTLEPVDNNTVVITGYNKVTEVIDKKTVQIPRE